MPSLGDEILQVRLWLEARLLARFDDGVERGGDIGAVNGLGAGEVFPSEDDMSECSLGIIVRKRECEARRKRGELLPAPEAIIDGLYQSA